MSKLILETLDKEKEVESINKFIYIQKLQEFGKELRKNKKDNSILAQLAVGKIHVHRREKFDNVTNESPRFLTIIDSLKREEEYHLLRAVYGDIFYLVGVLCPEDVRIKRLKRTKGVTASLASKIIEIDRDEQDDYGQKVMETLKNSDFFVNNMSSNEEVILPPLERFADILLANTRLTPTIGEYAMALAHTASLRSGCLSRQVGAAIVTQEGDVISTGRNDPPKPGGGLYCSDDGVKDCRCSKLHSNICFNTQKKIEIKSEIAEIVEKSLAPYLNDGEQRPSRDVILSIISEAADIPSLRGITEFSRSIHAEMDAITTAARNGLGKLKKARLYCTTYPCHSCARHIVAAGISEVYYIQPYDKSLASELHEDAITHESPEKAKTGEMTSIMPFEGVAPKSFFKLFKAPERKKNNGPEWRGYDPTSANPTIAKLQFRVTEYEHLVIRELKNKGLVVVDEDNPLPV